MYNRIRCQNREVASSLKLSIMFFSKAVSHTLHQNKIKVDLKDAATIRGKEDLHNISFHVFGNIKMLGEVMLFFSLPSI